MESKTSRDTTGSRVQTGFQLTNAGLEIHDSMNCLHSSCTHFLPHFSLFFTSSLSLSLHSSLLLSPSHISRFLSSSLSHLPFPFLLPSSLFLSSSLLPFSSPPQPFLCIFLSPFSNPLFFLHNPIHLFSSTITTAGCSLHSQVQRSWRC